MIQNPIIPGFAGDPSVVRAGDDYYIATSSFEWFPGVPIYHSRDLKNWKLADYALKTRKLLDLTGVKPSAGVWAPCLSFCEEEGLFYLLYSIVHSKNNWYFDVENYLVTSRSIHGPWSDPVYICSSGFDYSLFHDTDGRKWIVGKDRDFRPDRIDRRPIILQEYDPEKKETDRETASDLYRGHTAPVRGRTASVQAERMVLSDGGGRRYRIRSLCCDAPLPEYCRTVRMLRGKSDHHKLAGTV